MKRFFNTRVFIMLIAIIAIQIFLRIPFINEPLERDEGCLGYIGQRILAGEIPYRDVFDHKPPAVFFVYAFIIKLFGSSIFSIRVFTLFYGILTTLAVFGAAYLIFGIDIGLVAAFLYAVFSGTPLIQGASSNTETFMVLPMVLALICFLIAREKGKLWLVLAGVLSGLAFMMKQVSIFNFLALLIFTPLTSVLWPIAGFLLFPIIFSLYFILNGAFFDFVNYGYLANKIYLQASPAPFFFFDPCYGLDAIWTQMRLENGLLWLLSAAALIIAFFKERKYLFIAVWSIASFLGIASSPLFFGHYFIQIIPAFCLLSAFMVYKIFCQKDANIKIIFVALIFFVLLQNMIYQYPFYTRYNVFQISNIKYGINSFNVAYYVSLKLPKDKSIFVWAAEPEVYFYLNQKAPSKFPFYFFWMKNMEIDKRILSDVKNKKPEYIVWTTYTPYAKELEEYIIKNYNFKEKLIDWKIYERKS
ncbi:MAG: hypothetical protein FD145_888 [Candidatus Saganbacteria bacterium]|uniref:Glycosyltransferase RgtA/B/C/D-like domain-containing protein n=1 Tax=Candidatus Saganbacteria bacterium TaxID=2575572 RepID=A0A833NRZ3_UNCSA|nr:MAG: hypothetical protein FD145_888 [Candidatus Saganbacteria bacterium]